MRGCEVFQFNFRIIFRDIHVAAKISRALKLDKNSPAIPVNSIPQQAERQTSIPKVWTQIALESIFFSWLRRCQIIMKNFCWRLSLRMILKKRFTDLGNQAVIGWPLERNVALELAATRRDNCCVTTQRVNYCKMETLAMYSKSSG